MAEKRPQETRLERMRRRARALKAETYALYLAYRDPRVPWYAKVLVAVVVGYAFSPLDLVPDFIPGLGYLDDLVLVPLGIALALKLIPTEVMADARVEAAQVMRGERPRNWYLGAVIILIWLLLLALSILLTFSLFRCLWAPGRLSAQSLFIVALQCLEGDAAPLTFLTAALR